MRKTQFVTNVNGTIASGDKFLLRAQSAAQLLAKARLVLALATLRLCDKRKK